MGGAYRLIRSRATAAEFHARAIPEPASPEIWWHDVSAPALVLGSTQRDSVVDGAACAAAGVEVVRRRSGGGAVLLVPGGVTWVDVIVPRDAPGWATDLHAPMRWLGEHLARVLRELMPHHRIDVHGGRPVTTRWSSLVCFDGVGAGEVLLDGAKLVGISQRRTRHAARLQCCWYSSYDPAALVDLLSPVQRPPLGELAPVATLTPDVALALAERLPATLP